jgi:hypothetical protein
VFRGGVHGFVTAVVIALAITAGAQAGEVTQTDLGSKGGYDYRRAQGSDLGAHQSFFIFAQCAEGDAVTGGGGLIGASATYVRLTRTVPFHIGPTAGKPREAWAAGAENMGDSPAAFSAFAICRKAGADGLAYRSSSKPIAGGEVKTVKARCPSGSAVLGGGGEMVDTLADIFFDQSRPFDGGDKNSRPDDGWQVRAFSSVGDYTLKAHAICTSKGISHLHYRSHTRPDITGPGTGDALAECHDDEVAVGGGASMTGVGSGWIGFTLPFASKADSNQIPEDGWEAAFYVVSQAGSDLTAYATCKG